MEKEYIIIDKTVLQKRIEELENDIQYYKANYHNAAMHEVGKVKLELEKLLSQSTPLIPEIERAYDAGVLTLGHFVDKERQYYIANLKLDI